MYAERSIDVPHQLFPSRSFTKISNLLPGICASTPSCRICWIPNVRSVSSHCSIDRGKRGARFFIVTYVFPLKSFVPYTFSNNITPNGTMSSACLITSSHVMPSIQSNNACSTNSAISLSFGSCVAGLTNHSARRIGSVHDNIAARTVPSFLRMVSNTFTPAIPCSCALYSSVMIPCNICVPLSPSDARAVDRVSGFEGRVSCDAFSSDCIPETGDGCTNT